MCTLIKLLLKHTPDFIARERAHHHNHHHLTSSHITASTVLVFKHNFHTSFSARPVVFLHRSNRADSMTLRETHDEILERTSIHHARFTSRKKGGEKAAARSAQMCAHIKTVVIDICRERASARARATENKRLAKRRTCCVDKSSTGRSAASHVYAV